MSDIIKILFLILNKQQKIKFIIALAMILISLLLETFGIGMILPIINILISGKKNTNIEFIDNYLNAFSIKETFFIFLIIFFIFFLFKNTIVLLTQFLQLKIVYEIKKILSKKLFLEFLFNNYQIQTQKNSSFFINKLGHSINDFTICLRFVFNTITDLSFILILLLFLFYLKPGITLGIIIVILVPSQIFIFLRKKKTII